MRNTFIRVLAVVVVSAGVAVSQGPPQGNMPGGPPQGNGPGGPQQGGGPGGGGQQQPFTTHQLAPNVYWIEGGGGNSGVIIGETGVILVDSKTSAAGGKELLDDVAKITPKPVKTVILTHSDGDHAGGLAGFPAGITVIAHENDKAELEAAIKAGGRGAPSPDHLPTRVVTGKGEDVTLDGVKLRLLHWAPAHTSGDLVIFLPTEKILFAGDILTINMPDPLIHQEKNGTSTGWIESMTGMAALPADRYVPGHGDVQTKAVVQQRLAAASAKRTKIVALVKEGKMLDEIRVAVGDPPAQPAGGQNRGPNFPSFTEVVYKELTK